MIRKAFLLAAGLGTRLKPLTDTTPKCLIPVHGRPLLGHWIELLERHGLQAVLINTHHLAKQVRDYAAKYKGPLRLQVVYEAKLLGSAGTIRANRDFVKGEESFLICYADNLTNLNLTRFWQQHEMHSLPLTVGLFSPEHPERCGVAQLAPDGRVLKFDEKPRVVPDVPWANAGIYIARQELFDFIPDQDPVDMGCDVLPKLCGRMQGVVIEGYLRDLGDIESLKRAEEEWGEVVR